MANHGRRRTLDEGPRHEPGLKELLASLRLDVAFQRAAGDFVFFLDEHGDEVRVLDLVGGFGTALVGHGHTAVVAAATDFLASGRANHVQGSVRRESERLAAALTRRAGGGYRVVLGNSGSDAVDAALRHAMATTGSRTFLTLDRGFHGKTLGTRAATATCRSTAAGEFRVVHIPPNDVEVLDAAIRSEDDLAGFLFEPVQGEGGVRPLDPAFVHRAAELCAARRLPLIADECQTGLGRTGTFLACTALEVRPDYVVVSKALGGTVAKVSALLIDEARYDVDLEPQFTSTFAGDEFSSTIACRVLELLDEETLRCGAETGRWFRERLRELAERFPDVIADVRGTGLMIGVELRVGPTIESRLLRSVDTEGRLAQLVAAYLLHVHRLRVAPTLGDPATLRIQPSVFVARTDLERALSGFEDVAERVTSGDVAGLMRFLTETEGERKSDEGAQRATPARLPIRTSRCAGERLSKRTTAEARVAWLFHLVDESDLPHLDPGLATFAPSERTALLDRLARLATPIAYEPFRVTSPTGGSTWCHPIGLPVTSRWFAAGLSNGARAERTALVQHGVDRAREIGCVAVSLGQFTSIVTRGGRDLWTDDMTITSGNATTAALAVDAVRRAVEEAGRDLRDATLAVVGAAGDVGQRCARALATSFGLTLLFGSSRPGSQRRLSDLAPAIPRATACGELDGLDHADVVLCATNATMPILGPFDVGPHAIVCDVAVPPSVEPSFDELRPDVRRIEGAVVELPGVADVRIPGYPLAAGRVHGCLAEALLIGLEPGSIGASLDPIERMHRHGFVPRGHEPVNASTREFEEPCHHVA